MECPIAKPPKIFKNGSLKIICVNSLFFLLLLYIIHKGWALYVNNRISNYRRSCICRKCLNAIEKAKLSSRLKMWGLDLADVMVVNYVIHIGWEKPLRALCDKRVGHRYYTRDDLARKRVLCHPYCISRFMDDQIYRKNF